jgi:hypothetical protein
MKNLFKYLLAYHGAAPLKKGKDNCLSNKAPAAQCTLRSENAAYGFQKVITP